MLCFTVGRLAPKESTSWKASAPMSEVDTCPAIATIGTESRKAVARPVRILVNPGPEVHTHTPGLPDARA